MIDTQQADACRSCLKGRVVGKNAPKTPELGDVLLLLESLAPSWLAEKWDNCGLQVGSRSWPVRKIWVALDPLPEVVASAARQEVDLLITHHPLLFTPLRSIDLATSVGRIIETAVVSKTALFAAHTNLDSARNGINDLLCERIGLRCTAPLVPSAMPGKDARQADDPRDGPLTVGLGRVGEFDQPVSAVDLIERLKEKLGLKTVRVAGQLNQMIRKAAVCSGSGGGLLSHFLGSDAQAYISGDFRYHDARSVEDAGRILFDVGHFSSEQIIIDALVKTLSAAMDSAGWHVRIEPCELERDPFNFL